MRHRRGDLALAFDAASGATLGSTDLELTFESVVAAGLVLLSTLPVIEVELAQDVGVVVDVDGRTDDDADLELHLDGRDEVGVVVEVHSRSESISQLIMSSSSSIDTRNSVDGLGVDVGLRRLAMYR
jgi:hypothetical protein